MNGKDMILYILQNDLEARPIFRNGRFLDFMTVEETAMKFDVGVATVKIWAKLNLIKHIQIGDQFWFPKRCHHFQTDGRKDQ